jgi:hypothetical protein
MILTFSKQQFVERIKDGTKAHTILEDSHNMWQKGVKIQFWLKNPRNTRGKEKPYQFGTGEVSRVESIRIDLENDDIYIGDDIVLKTVDELEVFAKNDGFDSYDDLFLWFSKYGKEFNGKIIFWRDFL